MADHFRYNNVYVIAQHQHVNPCPAVYLLALFNFHLLMCYLITRMNLPIYCHSNACAAQPTILAQCLQSCNKQLLLEHWCMNLKSLINNGLGYYIIHH